MKRTERAVDRLIGSAMRVAYTNETGSELQWERAKEKLAADKAAVMALIEKAQEAGADRPDRVSGGED